MRAIYKIFISLLFIFSLNAFGETFVEGKDYVLLESGPQIPATNGKVTILEFFSYGCPWCYKLESSVELWLKKKPQNIVFDRVPVTFEPNWDIYAKAYFTAKALGVENKTTPLMFAAIHEQNNALTSEEDIVKIFAKAGVSKKDFDSAYNFSPQIGLEMNQANALMQDYKIFEIPTFVVAGKYKTNLLLVKGNPQRLIAVLEFLANKESKLKKTALA